MTWFLLGTLCGLVVTAAIVISTELVAGRAS